MARVMATVCKDILYAGEWHLPDGRKFPCPAKDLPHYARRMSEMIAAGLHIPVVWEHQDDAEPVTLSEWQRRRGELAKLTVGHARGARLSGSALHADFDADDEDAKKIRRVKFVSPEIRWDYRDPTGRVWPGPSIIHIALTNMPVQHTQSPFQLSQGYPVRLSLAGYKPVRLGANDMADETLTAETPEITDGTAGGLDPKLLHIFDLLASKGCDLGPGVDKDNWMDRMVAAISTWAAEGAPVNDPAADPAAGVDEVPMPVAMSQRMQRLEARLLEDEKAKTDARIASLARDGYLPKPMLSRLQAEKATVRLSLDSRGKLADNALLAKLATLEELRQSFGNKPIGLSQRHLVNAKEVSPSDSGYTDTRGKEQAKEALTAMAKSIGAEPNMSVFE